MTQPRHPAGAPDLLEVLRRDSEAAQTAACPFEFDIARADHVEPVRLASGATLEAIAGDDTGGTYFLCGNHPARRDLRPVLYADSEGAAGLIADRLGDALEILIGLPSWLGLACRPAAGGDEALAGAVAEAEEELREDNPDIEEERGALLASLGLRRLPPVDLVHRLRDALARTEPCYVLLNAEEGHAYSRLDRAPVPPLSDTLLAEAAAGLARLRAAPDAGDEAGGGRRAAVLRAAQYDRGDGDAPLLHRLLEQELAHRQGGGRTEPDGELALAAVLLAGHGRLADLPLLGRALDALGAVPGAGAEQEEVLRWARQTDAAYFGQDRRYEDDVVWAGVARRLGLTETARVILLHLLDEHQFGRYLEAHDPKLAREEALRTLGVPALTALRDEFSRLGDAWQTGRAQRVLDQETAWTPRSRTAGL